MFKWTAWLIKQIITLHLFNYTRIPSTKTDCYPLCFFLCWCNQCRNIFQRVLYSSDHSSVSWKKSDKAILEKLVLLLHTEDVVLLKNMLRKIIKTFAVKSCLGIVMVLTEKQTLNLLKNVCTYIAYLNSVSLKENCIFLCHLKLVSAILYHFFYFFTKWWPLKNYERCFLFHLKSFFPSQDIQMFVIFPLPFHTS